VKVGFLMVDIFILSVFFLYAIKCMLIFGVKFPFRYPFHEIWVSLRLNLRWILYESSIFILFNIEGYVEFLVLHLLRDIAMCVDYNMCYNMVNFIQLHLWGVSECFTNQHSNVLLLLNRTYSTMTNHYKDWTFTKSIWCWHTEMFDHTTHTTIIANGKEKIKHTDV
jgi:hypothetical protein